MIDISAVQASHGKKEIDELVEIAKNNQFIAVHALPSWIPYLKERAAETDLLVGGPVGFPSGGHTIEVKAMEAKRLADDGVDEMDMMMNIGKFLSGDYDHVLRDFRAAIDAAGEVPVKLIIEAVYLTDDQIKQACELSIEAGAAFVKTGTGWAAGGATVDQIRMITDFVGGAIEVKAAGGVRGLAMFIDLYRMGVTRFGINLQSSLEILDEVKELPDGAVEVGEK